MKFRRRNRLSWLLNAAAILSVSILVAKAPTGSIRLSGASSVTAANAQTMTHDRRHMHVRNWAVEPTGIPGVSPLDPLRIPKFQNDLVKPPVFVPDNTRGTPHYTVTYTKSREQLLPPG